MRLRLIFVWLALLVSAPGWALPPQEHGRGFREGANHNLGDDSFLEAFGRDPVRADPEALRMHVHLAYVRGLLASHEATRPELADRRRAILGYLDEYIAAGITPKNTYVPWRNPVFIDATGHICAVGYLIERTAGRGLAEKIADEHRLDYLEDIAAAMPEVVAWVEQSGFTLSELASVQPGYLGPDVMHLNGFVAEDIVDGPARIESDGVVITGAFAGKKMTGDWKSVDAGGRTVGSGTFKAGSGLWTVSYPDGKKRAEGPFANNRAAAGWKFYHPSGRLAAEGSFVKGFRDGLWRFYQDADGKIPAATGRFNAGEVAGIWQHFDATGKLLATASAISRRQRPEWFTGGLFLVVAPGKDGIAHAVHGGIPTSPSRLDGYFLGNERIYVQEDTATFDADGNELSRIDGVWNVADCGWSAKEKAAARAGNVIALHGLLGEHDEHRCTNPQPLSEARSRRVGAILAAIAAIRAPIPDFVRSYIKPPEPTDEYDYYDKPQQGPPTNPAYTPSSDDLPALLAANMTWYMEWPHIDGLFREAFATMPGYAREVQ